MKIEVIETVLVCIIILMQLSVFARTYRQIRIFKTMIPPIQSLRITKILVPTADLEALSPQKILANADKYNNTSLFSDAYNTTDRFFENKLHNSYAGKSNLGVSAEKTEVNIIVSDAKKNPVFEKVLYAINNYMIRNRDVASDFNLIKDIVERNAKALEKDITSSMAVPLYLGLMGTIIGLVICLFKMPDLGLVFNARENSSLIKEGIFILKSGVKIALIPSFTGFLFTIINSAWIFKGSRSLSEARKNEFYTFVQIELLPLINQGLASTLESVQKNLSKFNYEFSNNLRGLSGIFDAARNTIREQKELVDSLDNAKVMEMTRYNIAVLKQLEVSVGQFEKFNSYLKNVTQFVDNSQQIVGRTNELLARTDNFKNIAESLEQKLSQSQTLMDFLSHHFINLNEHKAFTSNAVADVGHAISTTFKELKEHIQHSSEAVKQFTIDESETLKAALSESKTNLDHLENLAPLASEIAQFKSNASWHSERMNQAINELNKNVAKSIAIMEQIESRRFSRKTKNLTNSVKGLFKSKK